jgi:hypothetical protein
LATLLAERQDTATDVLPNPTLPEQPSPPAKPAEAPAPAIPALETLKLEPPPPAFPDMPIEVSATPPGFHPSVALEFDGQQLRAVENGKIMRSWPGVSGNPGYQLPEHQAIMNTGPIPEGEWILRQDKHQKMSLLGRFRSLFDSGAWRGGERAWGTERVWVDPAPETNTWGRSGFSVHGGLYPGSAGCIDLTSQMPNFADYFRSLGKDLKLTVRYPRSDKFDPPAP